MENPKVSIIIPVFNESKYVEENILGILSCDFPHDEMEILYIDGVSNDDTREIIHRYSEQYKFIKCLTNEKKFTPFAANIGIYNAKGKYIIFAGAHSKFDQDYIRRLLEEIERLNADAVGGMLRTEVVNRTPISIAIKRILENKYGVGNAYYRTVGAQEAVEVDTAGFLCYRKDRLLELGGYNEKLIRNQDIELNKRIKKNGGKIFLIPNTYVTYYARETYDQLARNNYQNGKWNILTVYYTKDFKSLSLRHFVPLIFLLSLIIPTLLSLIWFPYLILAVCSLSAYNFLVVTQSIKMNDKATTIGNLLRAFYTLHFSYGVGSIAGIVKTIKLKVFGE